MEPASWAAIASAAVAAAGTGYQIYSQATAPVTDTTDYAMLAETQAAADAESAAALALVEEARKREELRQSQLASSGIKTTDTGTESLSVVDQVLGGTAAAKKEETKI